MFFSNLGIVLYQINLLSLSFSPHDHISNFHFAGLINHFYEFMILLYVGMYGAGGMVTTIMK